MYLVNIALPRSKCVFYGFWVLLLFDERLTLLKSYLLIIQKHANRVTVHATLMTGIL